MIKFFSPSGIIYIVYIKYARITLKFEYYLWFLIDYQLHMVYYTLFVSVNNQNTQYSLKHYLLANIMLTTTLGYFLFMYSIYSLQDLSTFIQFTLLSTFLIQQMYHHTHRPYDYTKHNFYYLRVNNFYSKKLADWNQISLQSQLRQWLNFALEIINNDHKYWPNYFYKIMHSRLFTKSKVLCSYSIKVVQTISTDSTQTHLFTLPIHWYEDTNIASTRPLSQTLSDIRITTKPTTSTTAVYTVMISLSNRSEYSANVLFYDKDKYIKLVTERHARSNDKTFCLQLYTIYANIVQPAISMLRPSELLRVWVIFPQNCQILTYTAKSVQTQLKSKNNILLPYFIEIMRIDTLESVLISMCCISSGLRTKSDLVYILKLYQEKIDKSKSWSANILLFLLLYNKLDGG